MNLGRGNFGPPFCVNSAYAELAPRCGGNVPLKSRGDPVGKQTLEMY